MAFDRHMNIVLGDTEEFRKIKAKKGSGLSEEREEKRALGLIILRGDSVVSLTIEGPAPADGLEKAAPGGPGMGKPSASRGAPVAPVLGAAAPAGLAGPVRGVGGPALAMMQPPMPGTGPRTVCCVCTFLLYTHTYIHTYIRAYHFTSLRITSHVHPFEISTCSRVSVCFQLELICVFFKFTYTYIACILFLLLVIIIVL
jgi:hypothetical protein